MSRFYTVETLVFLVVLRKMDLQVCSQESAVQHHQSDVDARFQTLGAHERA